MLAQRQASWTALTEDVDFQMILFMVAAINFSALGVVFVSLSFFQENISKQNLCSKCTYRLKGKAFKIEINKIVNIL